MGKARRSGFGAALALLLAAGCSAQESDASDTAAAPDGEVIACAIAGANDYSRACGVERSLEGSTPILTVRHPDGGFRRFEVMPDGSGLAAADGAEPARVTFASDEMEVAVGADRYRFPASVAGDDTLGESGT